MRGGRRSCALISGPSCSPGSGASIRTRPRWAPISAVAHVAVPPPGAVPRELDKITLPPYVIEAPDQLLIEVVQRSTVTDKDNRTPTEARSPIGCRCSRFPGRSRSGSMAQSASASGGMSPSRA